MYLHTTRFGIFGLTEPDNRMFFDRSLPFEDSTVLSKIRDVGASPSINALCPPARQGTNCIYGTVSCNHEWCQGMDQSFRFDQRSGKTVLNKKVKEEKNSEMRQTKAGSEKRRRSIQAGNEISQTAVFLPALTGKDD